MKQSFIQFAKRLIIFSIIILIISYSVSWLLPNKFVSPAIPFILLFFFLITLTAYYFLINASEKKFSSFVNVFMIAMFLRLVIYIGILTGYIFLINRNDAVAFIGWFFVYYLLYTIFETIYIVITTKARK
jgi:hypothetical protein